MILLQYAHVLSHTVGKEPTSVTILLIWVCSFISLMFVHALTHIFIFYAVDLELDVQVSTVLAAILAICEFCLFLPAYVSLSSCMSLVL